MDTPINNNFRKEDILPLESEEQRILDKMKRISKKKNNFKNIEVLENIYEQEPTKSKEPTQSKNIFDTFLQLKEDVKHIEETLEGFSDDGFDENEDEGFSDGENEDEGFENEDEGFETYKDEYENEHSLRKRGHKQKHKKHKKHKKTKSKKSKTKKSKPGKHKKSKKSAKPGDIYGSDGKFNFRNFMKHIIHGIKGFFDAIFQIKKYIALALYTETDGLNTNFGKSPENSEKDVAILMEQIQLVFLVPFSIYFTYNWFYLMFYKDETGTPIPNMFTQTVLDTIGASQIIHYLFQCLIQPMIVANIFMRIFCPWVVDTVSSNMEKLKFSETFDFSFLSKIVSNPLLIFIALNIIILHMAYKYGDKMKNYFFAYLGDSKPPVILTSFLYTIILVDLFFGIQNMSKGKIELWLHIAKHQLAFAAAPVTTILSWLLLAVFSFMMVRFSGIFVILYLYFHSFFSLFSYSPNGPKSAFDSINLDYKKQGQTQLGKRIHL